MNLFWKRCTFPALLALAGAQGLAAQADPLEFVVKLRSGVALSSPKDHVSRKTLGMGLELAYASPAGRFSAELGYQYVPGDQYLSNVTAFPTAPGAPPLDAAASVDSRKNQFEGLTLRLAYGMDLTPRWSWQAGIQAGGSKYRQEYLGDVADANYTTYEDTYNGVVNHTAVPLSPFAGVRFRINDASSVELNLIALRYTSANYVHVGGTVPGDYGSGHTSLDHVDLEKRTLTHVEVAYGIHF